MPDRTQDLKNHRQVAVACKNYTDKEIKASEERILSIVARNNVDFIDHINEPTYRFTAPLNSKLLMLQSIAGNSLKYAPTTASDSTTAYQKTIPSYSPSLDRASASMNILGGMSYKVNQLIDSGTDDTREASGVTTVLHNGKYTASGTATANDYNVASKTITLKANHKYLILTNVTGTSQSNTSWQIYCSDLNLYTIDNRIYNNASDITTTIRVVYYNGAVLSMSYTIMLFNLTADFGSGNEPTSVSDCATEYAKRGIDIYSYTPQQSDIRDTPITSVKSVGVNVMGLEDVASTTRNGITYNISNGVISLNGTVTSGFELKLYFNEIASGTYSSLLSTNKTGSVFTDSLWLIANGASYPLGRINDTKNTFTISDKSNYIRIWLYTDESFTDVQIKITLVKGSTQPTTYIPYFSDTLTIDSNIQALDGYGWGISDNLYNYVDFNSKKFKKIVGKYTVTGTEDWYYDANSNRVIINTFDRSTPVTATLNAISDYSKVPVVTNNYSANGIYFASNNGRVSIWVKNAGVITDSISAKSELVGRTFYFELATPVETDISEYLDGNEIEIEPNGTLSFESIYSAYVPSNVSYNGVIKHALATAVKQEGANLCTGIEQGVWEGTPPYNKLASNQRARSIDRIPVKPNTTYTLSITGNLWMYVRQVNESLTTNVESNWITGNTYTFTTSGDMVYVELIFRNANGTDIMPSEVGDVMLNEGSTALSYRPYKAPITRLLPNSEAKYSWGITDGVRNTRVFCDDEGNAVNEGSLNVNNVDMGTLTYGKQYADTEHEQVVTTDLASLIGKPASASDSGNIVCTKYATTHSNDVYNHSANNIIAVGPSGNVTLYSSVLIGQTTSVIKSSVDGTPLFYGKNQVSTETLDDFDYFFDCEEGDVFTIIGCELLQCYATYSFLIKEAKSNE